MASLRNITNFTDEELPTFNSYPRDKTMADGEQSQLWKYVIGPILFVILSFIFVYCIWKFYCKKKGFFVYKTSRKEAAQKQDRKHTSKCEKGLVGLQKKTIDADHTMDPLEDFSVEEIKQAFA